jgi:hypothetical protein
MGGTDCAPFPSISGKASLATPIAPSLHVRAGIVSRTGGSGPVMSHVPPCYCTVLSLDTPLQILAGMVDDVPRPFTFGAQEAKGRSRVATNPTQ